MGKTTAIKLGIEKSTGDIILIQDADLEYSPKNYPDLLEPILVNKATIVYGSRFKGSIKGMTLTNRLANIFSNITATMLFAKLITDVNTCYKAFKKDVLQDITIESKNFTFETEITAKLLRKGHNIHEIPINYIARTQKKGKKMNWPKALEMYAGLIKYRFSRLA